MSHLTLEALARLVDEAAAPDEEAHLLDCAACRDELRSLREQRESLAALPRLMPAPDRWSEIRSQLRAEGVVRTGGAGFFDVRRLGPAWRAAAAVLLFLAGGASGYALRGGAEEPVRMAVETMDEEGPGSSATGEAGADAAPIDMAPIDLAGTDVAGADAAPSAGPSEGAGSESDRQAPGEDGFQLALDRFMEDTPAAADPAARLAALDNILLITAEALSEAPSDPVINGYYRTAVAQRNAILRQIGATRADPVF